MAEHPATRIALFGPGVKPAVFNVVTISGTVQSVGVPAERDLIIFRNTNYTPHRTGTSDPTTGAYSIDANGGPNDEFIVLAIGGPGENDAVFGNITM